MSENRFWLAVIVIIALATIWINLPGDPATTIDEDRFKIVQGLDLQGGSRVLLQSSIDADSAEMDVAADIIEQRVNGLGLTEASVRRSGTDRIIVELPGVSDRELALRAVQGTGLLEFVNFAGINRDYTGQCIITTEQIDRLKEQRDQDTSATSRAYTEIPEIELLDEPGTDLGFVVDLAQQLDREITFRVYDNDPNVSVRLDGELSLDGFTLSTRNTLPATGTAKLLAVNSEPQEIELDNGSVLYYRQYILQYTAADLEDYGSENPTERFTVIATDTEGQEDTQTFRFSVEETEEEEPDSNNEITTDNTACVDGEFLDRNGQPININTIDNLDSVDAFPTAESGDTRLTGAILDDAQEIALQFNQWAISFSLTGEGDEAFANYTGSNVGNPMAIVLDGRVISAPTIQSRIAGTGQITGDFSREEAEVLAAQLRYGALPVPLEVAAFTTVGADLGEAQIARSVRAGIVGVIVVLLFMIIYYRVPGVAAALALVLFISINFAIFKSIPVTLTLPAITGFLIAIGTAVDGNVLIFERMKEELRAGRSLEKSVELGFERAWTSIRDSNLSTIIIGIILFLFGSQFGASEVQGFAITLIIGLSINLFTAVIVTRTFLGMILEWYSDKLRHNRTLMGA